MRRTFREILQGSRVGLIVLFEVIFLVTVLSGGAFLSLAEHTVSGTKKGFGANIAEMYALLIDPGTQTALLTELPTPKSLKVVVEIVFSLIGFTYFLIVFGVAVEVVMNFMNDSFARYSMIHTKDHLLVLGWTGKTVFLLRELAQMLTEGPDQGGVIVVLGAALTPGEMEEQVALTIGYDLATEFPRVQIRYWQGETTNVAALQRVSVDTAASIIILGDSHHPHVGDAHVVSTLWAARTLSHRAKLRDDCVTVMELHRKATAKVVRQLGTHLARPIAPSGAIDELIALSMFSSAAALAHTQLLSFAGSDLVLVPASFVVEQWQQGGGEGPCTCAQVRALATDAILLGVHRPHAPAQRGALAATPPSKAVLKAESVSTRCMRMLAPPDSFALQPDDYLIMIRNEYDNIKALYGSKEGAKESRRTLNVRGESFAGSLSTAVADLGPAKDLPSASSLPPPTAYRKGAAVVGDAAATRVFVFVGWPLGFKAIVRSIDARATGPCEVVVLSAKDIAWRKDELHALALKNVRFTHAQEEVGLPTDEETLERSKMALANAEAVVVSADLDEGEDAHNVTDAKVLMAAILVTEVYKGALGGAARAAPLRLTAIFHDAMTRRLLESKPELLRGANRSDVEVLALHRQQLETAALSTSAHMHVAWLFQEELLEAEGGVDLKTLSFDQIKEALIAKAEGTAPAADASFVHVSFQALASCVSGSGQGVLIGWRRSESLLEMNPGDKTTPQTIAEGDVAIVVAGRDSSDNELKPYTFIPAAAPSEGPGDVDA